MVDVILNDEHDGGRDDDRPPTRRTASERIRSGYAALHRHGRPVVVLGLGLTLVAGSAAVARIADERGKARTLTATMSSIDGALLAAPTDLAVLWTSAGNSTSTTFAATAGRLLAYSDGRRAIEAVNADTGASVWSRTLPDGEAYVQCVAPAPDLDSFPCMTSAAGATFVLVMLGVADGTELTRLDLPDTTAPILVATDDADILLAHSEPDGSGTITRRSPVDGTTRWTAPVPAPASPPQAAGLASSVQSGLAIFQGQLTATLDAVTGAPIQDLPPPTEADWDFVMVQSLPDGAAALWRVATRSQDEMGIVRDATGATRFPLTEPPLYQQADDGSVPDLLLLSAGDSVHAVDAQTGEPRWTTAIAGYGVTTTVRYDDAITLLGLAGTTTNIEQHDLRTGDLRWSTPWTGVQNAQVTLAGGSLLLTGASDEFAASENYQGRFDRLAVVDLDDGSLRELPWPDGLSTDAWLTVLDHRLYGITGDQQDLIRLG